MAHETALNTKLGELLSTYGLIAEGQSKQASGKEWDVEIRGQGWIAACEAKKLQTATSKKWASRDAQTRIRKERADFAIAVCYPEDVTIGTLRYMPDLIWSVYTSLEEAGGWRTGSVRDLAHTIRRVGEQQLGNPDLLARRLTATFDDAIRRFTSTELDILCKSVDLPSNKKDKGRNGAIRAMLILAAAVMFHSRLDKYLTDMRPVQDRRHRDGRTFVGVWPPTKAKRCALSHQPVDAFLEAWHLILALGYRPIFEPAREVLIESYSIGPDFAAAVTSVADSVLSMTLDVAGLRHDLLGRIFHRVLDTARYDGSYYTSTAAATLLAHLSISDDSFEWRDTLASRQLKIVDPACGTGTLLMAAAEQIRDLTPDRNNDVIAKALIEDTLVGLDINLTATHMAATTLGLISPTTDFARMQIARAGFGVNEENSAQLGSLELLSGRLKTEPWPGRQIETGKEMDPPISDLVIMNPPYTRDSLRYDQLNRSDERVMKSREKVLLGPTVAHRTGSVGGFVVLGEQLTRHKEGSTLAMVLPLTFATDAAGRGCRVMLAERLYIDTIVCSHDPKRIYFSENTSIGEILLVSRRRRNNESQVTKVVKLVWNPATPADADILARHILSNDLGTWGVIQEWPQEHIVDGNWGSVQFLSVHLSNTFVSLKRGQIVPITQLGSIAYVGPEGRRTRDAFVRTSMPASSMRALWFNKSAVTQCLAADPDSYIVPKDSKTHLAEKYWDQRSRLLLPADPRLDTAKSLAVRIDEAILGSRWIPVRPLDSSDVMEKALTIWFNSSIGILAMLGDRTSKVLSRPRLSIGDIRHMPVPRMSKDVARAFAGVFDRLGRLPLGRLRQVETDRVRLQIDEVVARELSIDPSLVASVRYDLAREPSITNRRYDG